MTAFFFPRLLDLDKFVAVDEVNWMFRSGSFYSALVKRDFAKTFVAGTPGVITMWIESAAFKIQAPNYLVYSERQISSYYLFEEVLKDINVHPMEILQLARVFMVLFLGVILGICLHYSIRLFGFWPSYIGFFIVALDPYFIALSRMSHLDAPQAVLMLLALLALCKYLYKNGNWVDLLISGVAGGMAFLEKLPGVLIVPIIFLFLFADFFNKYLNNKKEFKKYLINFLKISAIWSAVFLLTFFLLWPAMWVNPLVTLDKFLGGVISFSNDGLHTITSTASEHSGINVTSRSDRLTFYYFFRYPKTYLSKTTPVALLGLLSFLTLGIANFKKLINKENKNSLLGLLILIVIYTIGMTLPSKSSDKYYAPVHLSLSIISGIGWANLFNLIFNKYKNKVFPILLAIAIFFGQLFFTLQNHPYYFTYFNPMLGGLQQKAQTSFIGVGEGLDIAGRYLSDKPDSENLRVMVWYGMGPFSYFFDGYVHPLYSGGEDSWTVEFIEDLKSMDYLVVYTNQKYRKLPPQLFISLENVIPEYTVEIRGAEYAWIYRVEDIPLEPPFEK